MPACRCSLLQVSWRGVCSSGVLQGFLWGAGVEEARRTTGGWKRRDRLPEGGGGETDYGRVGCYGGVVCGRGTTDCGRYDGLRQGALVGIGDGDGDGMTERGRGDEAQ